MSVELDSQVCSLLVKIHAKWKPTTFGKIAQSLLAITLHNLGWRKIRNHLSEDADIDAIDPNGRRCTFEAKTTKDTSVLIEEKDISCLNQRSTDGYEGFLVGLRVRTPTKWLVVPASSEVVKAGRLSFLSMGLTDSAALSTAINSEFNNAVKTSYATIIEDGLEGLRALMSRLGIESDEA